jgi:CCR4-NOT transcription complex subunit 6
LQWLYYGKLRKPTDPVPGPEDGVCLSYNASRLEKLASEKIRFGDYASKTLLASSLSPIVTGKQSTGTTPISAYLDFVKEREDGAIIALLRDTQANQLFVAASLHLYWDPKHPEIKAAQATLLCAAIREFLERQSTNSIFTHNTSTSVDQPSKEKAPELVVTKKFKRHDASEIPVIIGGDFNSLPIKRYSDAFDTVPEGEELVSGVYELLTKGQITSEHQDHPARRRRIKGDGGSGGDFQKLRNIELTSKGFVFNSAAKEAWGSEPLFTNRTPGFTGCLDYIFFSAKNFFEVSEILEMPFGSDGSGVVGEEEKEAEVLGSFPPIPNEVWPSDHLAVGAKLRWK